MILGRALHGSTEVRRKVHYIEVLYLVRAPDDGVPPARVGMSYAGLMFCSLAKEPI